MKIISIVGTRPQFIKLAPLHRAFNNFSNQYPESNVQHLICHTGQHYDLEMSDSFFNELEIPVPDYNIGISGGNHGEQTGRMLIEIEKIVLKERPDIIIVFGDTNSTLAGTLAGSKLGIATVHVEAGLRSFNKTMPEEINRIIADHTSDYLFAPTKTAFENLCKENLGIKSYLTGDIMVDSLRSSLTRASRQNILSEWDLKKEEYYLLTLHRPYNVDAPAILTKILSELKKLTKLIIFPVHPRTKKIIDDYNLPIPENIKLLKPLGYLDFIQLQLNSLKILTDSGGIQKEAYILKKPCITLRSETEWAETLVSGWNILINPCTDVDYSETIESFEPPDKYDKIFGEDVAKKMVEIINRIDD